jgi:hypothetical protein
LRDGLVDTSSFGSFVKDMFNSKIVFPDKLDSPLAEARLTILAFEFRSVNKPEPFLERFATSLASSLRSTVALDSVVCINVQFRPGQVRVRTRKAKFYSFTRAHPKSRVFAWPEVSVLPGPGTYRQLDEPVRRPTSPSALLWL